MTFPSAWSGVPSNINSITTINIYGTSVTGIAYEISGNTVVFDNILTLSGVTVNDALYI